MSFELKVWGDFALFTRPETKSEPVSYPGIIPTAALGILESIFWKPEFKYQINSAKVLNPIRFINLKINNVHKRINPADILKREKEWEFIAPDYRTQRNYTLLRDVAYVLNFDIVLEEHTQSPFCKYQEQLTNRVDNGRCFFRPFFGCREHVAYFEWATGKETVAPELNHITIDMGTVPTCVSFVPCDSRKDFYNKATINPKTGERGFKPGYMQVKHKNLKIENGIIIF